MGKERDESQKKGRGEKREDETLESSYAKEMRLASGRGRR